MKAPKALFVGLALLAVVFTTSADDKSSSQHWYQVTIVEPQSYTFVGTSPLQESALAAELSKADGAIELDNLLYRDKDGNYKDWHVWDPTTEPRIYLHTKYIVAFQPLVGDPRKMSSNESK